ncbi:MAG: hypothetical protein INR71_11795, partial [Terriglobus roseus]|nr:hypothetical protein [Terriglobus roseus]
MQGLTAEQYVSRNIDPSQCEIEHLGLNALYDVLLKPAGIALEVLYLDRSPGTDVYPHRFDPIDAAGASIANAPTIRLLYRPGHYDILYSFDDPASLVPPVSTSKDVSQNRNDVFVGLASPTDESPRG